MSGFYADLVVPDLGLRASLEQVGVTEVVRDLTALAGVAERLGLGREWGRTTAAGTDQARSVEQHGFAPRGASEAMAPTVGVGFVRDSFVAAEADEHAHPLAQAQARIRRPEVAAVMAVAEAARAEGRPVVALLDVRGTWRTAPEPTLRRRLAHLLAFEAGLAVGRTDAWTQLFPVLATGTGAQLDEAARALPDAAAFSVLLNLLGALREGRAYERQTGQPHPDLGAAVAAGEQKDDLLVRRLGRAAERRSVGLHRDAKIALHALLSELSRVGEIRRTAATIPPRWGLLAEASAYEEGAPVFGRAGSSLSGSW